MLSRLIQKLNLEKYPFKNVFLDLFSILHLVVFLSKILLLKLL